ncbi:MAG: Arylsulfatase [Verrucomicrobiota bacterium]|jgi:arylsulfatase A-like enzyme
MKRLLFAVLLMAGWGILSATAATRPNVIVILVDDLGWTDLGCYGSPFHQTPHLDQLARDGLRFTQAYSACTVCSPTRASLLTGQYPARLHLTDWIPGDGRTHAPLKSPVWTQQLSTNQWNLARALKGSGYATASVGKWHLGGPECSPEQQGFDRNVGGTHRGQPPSYVSPYRIPTLVDGPAGEFLTDREAAEACAFIESHRDRPFFLYLAHYAVHQPIAGKPEVVARYRARADPSAPQHHAAYAALLESVDDAVGRIRSTLDSLQLAERTLILFTSDNGGLVLGGTNAPTSNVPLRSGKGSPYEGGVRVPLIACWPGVIPSGRTNNTPVITPDLYSTVLELAGVADAPGHVVDGISLAPLTKGRGSIRREAIYWHYPHYHSGGATPYGAVRSGDWRLIEFFEDGRQELYDLHRDPGEKTNQVTLKPWVADKLRNDLTRWRERVGAQMPVRNQ